MAIFKLTAPGGPAMIVRARCLSCARDVAVANHGPEGTFVWRDPASSKCELLRKSAYNPEGKSALLERLDRHD